MSRLQINAKKLEKAYKLGGDVAKIKRVIAKKKSVASKISKKAQLEEDVEIDRKKKEKEEWEFLNRKKYEIWVKRGIPDLKAWVYEDGRIILTDEEGEGVGHVIHMDNFDRARAFLRMNNYIPQVESQTGEFIKNPTHKIFVFPKNFKELEFVLGFLANNFEGNPDVIRKIMNDIIEIDLSNLKDNEKIVDFLKEEKISYKIKNLR